MEFLTGILGSAKQITPALLIGVALACGGSLFLPLDLLEHLGMTTLIKEHRTYIGSALLISLAFLVAQAMVGIWTIAKKLYAKIQEDRKSSELEYRKIEMLSKLTPEEKEYLSPYIFQNENTQYFSIQDGVVGGLTAKHILYRASNFSTGGTNFAFNMQPWARDILENSPNLLG